MLALESRGSFLRTIAQVTAEREAARHVVQSLRGSRFDLWEKNIDESWRTAGFVQELTAAASAILETEPRESLSLAQLALAVATSIPPDSYPDPIQPQIEGTAWREIGTAHRYLGEFDAALRAYDAAHRSFASVDSLSYEEAILDFARAILLVELFRYPEALALLDSVTPRFESFGDESRVVRVALLRGNIWMFRGQPQNARPIYEKALTRVPPDDLQTMAALHQNMGRACADLGEYNDAVLNLHHALQLLTGLGMTMEVHRAEWNLARVHLLKGEFAKALPTFRRVRTYYLQQQSAEDAGSTGLDIVEALIATEKPAEARELVVTVLGEFTRANLSSHALTALAYLRDVLPTARQPRRAVRHVREYLDRLRTEPARLFLPLAED